MDDSTKALKVEEVFEPLNFETAGNVALDVSRSLDKEFLTEGDKEKNKEEEANKEDNVPLIRRNTRKGKHPLESPPLPAQSKRPKRAAAAKKHEPSSIAPLLGERSKSRRLCQVTHVPSLII